MINYLTYDGKNLREFGLYVNGAGTFDAPARSIEKIVVPGRSGTLTIDNKRFDNINVTYESFIVRDFNENIEGLRNYLMAKPGYRRLEETYHPDEYRMARFISGMQVKATPLLREGNFKMTFDCMPQRFLKSGEIPVEYTANGNIYNPTLYQAKPLLRIWGNGSVGIGSNTITLAGTTDYTDIDCESMDAYYGATNRNDKISGAFPVLEPGQSGVTLGAGITKVQITPRWWII